MRQKQSKLKMKLITLSLLLLSPLELQAFSLGIVSDIHAGSKSVVSERRKNWYYPSRYCDNLEGVKKSGADYILTLGDNTLNGRESEAKKIIDCLKGYAVIWTKGNHDKEAAWKHFNAPNYYSKEVGDWKIIVLDSSKKFPGGSGGFRSEQLLWLEKELLCSDKVLIAMHHNIFQYELIFPKLDDTIFSKYLRPPEIATAYSEYDLFKHMLETSGKVRYVYSGHLHGRRGCKKIDGITYCSVSALSLKNAEGYFSVLSLE